MMKSLKTLTKYIFIGFFLCHTIPIFADDIDIYVNKAEAGSYKPNILFFLDNSKSMNRIVPPTGKSRIQIVEEVLSDTLSDIENVNVGIGRFVSGYGKANIPILYPVKFIDAPAKKITSARIITPKYPSHQKAIRNSAIELLGYRNKVVIKHIFSNNFQSLSKLPNKNILIGLRFQNINIPYNAEIQSAKIAVHQIDPKEITSKNTSYSYSIEIENDINASSFQDKRKNLSDRKIYKKISSTFKWIPSSTYETPDISELIRGIIKNKSWDQKNNALVFLLKGIYPRDPLQKIFYPGKSPADFRLIITYKNNVDIKGSSSREEIIRSFGLMIPGGGTPLVDALYEAALYYGGKEVHYGLSRRYHKLFYVSHPDSYLGGYHQIDSKCDIDLDPNSDYCASEKILSPPTAIYKSPISSACQRNYLVLLTDGQAEQNYSSSLIPKLIKKSCQRNWNGFVEKSSERCGISLAQYLSKNNDYVVNRDTDGDQILEKVNINTSIKIHTIGFKMQNTDYIKKIAEYGGGKFYDTSEADDLKSAFEEILVDAMTSSASFAKTGTSIDRFNKRHSNDTVYYNLVKPTNKRRWYGNLKKYKIENNRLIDQLGNIAAENNYFKENSQSYWSSIPDGGDVLLGGAGEKLQKIKNLEKDRNIYTICGKKLEKIHKGKCDNNSMNNTFGVQNEKERKKLIEWILGKDVMDENENGNRTENRWMFGEPLHSSAQLIQYTRKKKGSDDDKKNKYKEEGKIILGTNDGLIHMIDDKTGEEDWAFLVPEMLSKQKEMMENIVDDGYSHIYGMDGIPSLWIYDEKNDGISSGKDFVKMFIGMRRGGKNIYAFDLTKTYKPKLIWKIIGGSRRFEKLGQTWSYLRPVLVDPKYCGKKKGECAVLLFGGGYDEVQDHNFLPSQIGSAIYMVEAKTGDRLWWASDQGSGADLEVDHMNYPIPSELKVLDSDGNGYMDRIYVGDVGGQLWRFDLFPQNEKGGRLAIFSNNTTQNDQRRFFYPPEYYKIPKKNLEVIMVGSGNKNDPLNMTVQNRVYTFIDKGWKTKNAQEKLQFYTEDDLVDVDLNTSNDFNFFGSEKVGWLLKLSFSGEKMLSSPIIGLRNKEPVAFFSTYVPPNFKNQKNSCDSEDGITRLYALEVSNADPLFEKTIDENGKETFDQTKKGKKGEDRSISATNGQQDIILKRKYPNGENSIYIPLLDREIDLDPHLQAGATYWLQVEEDLEHIYPSIPERLRSFSSEILPNVQIITIEFTKSTKSTNE